MDGATLGLLYLGLIGIAIGAAAVLWSNWAEAREREPEVASSTPAE